MSISLIYTISPSPNYVAVFPVSLFCPTLAESSPQLRPAFPLQTCLAGWTVVNPALHHLIRSVQLQWDCVPCWGGLADTLSSPSFLEALPYFMGMKYIISSNSYFISVLYENQYPIPLAIFCFTYEKCAFFYLVWWTLPSLLNLINLILD